MKQNRLMILIKDNTNNLAQEQHKKLIEFGFSQIQFKISLKTLEPIRPENAFAGSIGLGLSSIYNAIQWHFLREG